MRIRLKTFIISAAAALTVAACSAAVDQQAQVHGTPGAPGGLEYRDTWAPGYQYDMDDGKYYRIRPTDGETQNR